MRILINILFFSILCCVASSQSQRVIGGSPADISSWPFAVSMLYNFHNMWVNQACGGTLLTSQIVLSAAHCFDGDSANIWQARLGSSHPNSGGSVHSVSAITRHSEYNDRTLDYDIAMLKLTTSAPLGNEIGVAQIAGATYVLPAGTTVTALGYGEVDTEGTLSSTLNQVEMVTADWSTCQNAYSNLKQVPGFSSWPDVTSNMLCTTSHIEGRDTCKGDAGSPVVHNGQVVIAVTSWGYGCGSLQFPSVNTDVSKVVDWILANAA